MELLNYNHYELIRLLSDKYGKGAYHGDALFRHIYSRRNMNLSEDPCFRDNRELSSLLQKDFSFTLPAVREIYREEGTVKFCLDLDPAVSCETVLIPMKKYETLCVSSQLGCRWNCRFCETGRMGLIRNLTTADILAQVLTARFQLGADNLRNLVFMGMGEPLENLDAVLKAVDILSDSRGINLPAKYISLSTAGYVPGIRELSRRSTIFPERNYHKLHLSLSLHSADPETRSTLMPINRAYPLDELKTSLMESPYSRRKDGLYVEYLILPGVNDTDNQIDKLLFFLEGMEVKINLIPYNPGRDPQFRKPERQDIDRLWEKLRSCGFSCRTRTSRGESVMAACGQLGNRECEK